MEKLEWNIRAVMAVRTMANLTTAGNQFIQLTDAPMNAALVEELADWQSLSLKVWDAFPYEEDAEEKLAAGGAVVADAEVPDAQRN